jgi:Holliday junction resolvasome RuvABC endonuclease subunit
MAPLDGSSDDDVTPAPGGVLAFDLGGTVGWAYGHIRTNQPYYGSFKVRLPRELEGERYVRLSNALCGLLKLLKPSKVIIEAPLPHAALNNQAAANQQYGMRAIGMCEVARVGLNAEHYSADLVRYEVLGRARFPKGQAKKYVLQWARQSGFRLLDDQHDIADALALWEYYCSRLRMGLHGNDPALLTQQLY